MAAAESPVLKLFGKTISLSQSNHSPIPSPPPPPPTSEGDQHHNTSATAAGKAAVSRALTCPRCKSKETKFCYFNNYNVKQPRHFCRSCHRYWTAGGALRSVPVGAARRKSQSHHHCNLPVR